MKRYGIQAEYIKNQQRNYNKERMEKYVKPDLLKRKFDQPGWVTDVTYLIFGSKRAFLSSILDLQHRKVIAYQISYRNDIKLVMDTLLKALKKTKDPNGIILHSDQGTPYFSYEYRSVCESNGILISMSRKGTPLDNAVIESFHALLKKETLYNNDIKSLSEYIKIVHQWINFYNTKRLKQKK
jgi:transposase InsO family protein